MRNMRTRDGLSKNNRIEDLSSITIFKRIVLFVGLFIAAFLLYHRDILVGRWKLHVLCELDAGSRIYEPLERNVGWIMPGFYEERDKSPNFLPSKFRPAFIRFIKDNGDEFDMLKFDHRDNYEIIPADKSKPVRYIYNSTGEYPGGDKRFWKNNDIIIDVNKRIIVASYTTYSFKWFITKWVTSPKTSCANAPLPLDNNDFPREVYGDKITHRRIFN